MTEPAQRPLEESRRAVAPLAEELELPRRLEPFAPYRWDGEPPRCPVLHLDDVSAIPFLVDVAGVEEYQHRARLRAGDGDLVAAVTPPTEGEEDYFRGRLGLGRPGFVLARPTAGPLAVAAACGQGEALEHLAARARVAGALAIHPYMGIEAVWELARAISGAAGVRVTVLGPPPPATWTANDKGLFGEVVRRVLGEEWLVETHTASDPASLAALLLGLAGRHEAVGLKRLRCASGMGNAVYPSGMLRGRLTSFAEAEVRRFLARTEWEDGEAVLAVAWEEADLSPSTQLWIPPLVAGDPRLDGIYEQILEGEARVFVGSRPSRLPAAVNRRLEEAALRVGAALQALGYCGRCSFDHLLVGDPRGEFRIRFTECNGRWGGTSTPMALLDRLGRSPRPPYRAQDFVHPGLVGTPFRELLARVGEAAYEATSGRGRFIFYNLGPLEAAGKLDVIAVGRTQEEAEAAIQEELPAILGL